MAKKKQSKCRDEVWNNSDNTDNIRYEVVVSPCEPTKDGEDDKLTVAFWAIAVYMENLLTEWNYEEGTFNKYFKWAPFIPRGVVPYVGFDRRGGCKNRMFVYAQSFRDEDPNSDKCTSTRPHHFTEEEWNLLSLFVTEGAMRSVEECCAMGDVDIPVRVSVNLVYIRDGRRRGEINLISVEAGK